MGEKVYGEDDPKVIKAARAIAACRNARRVKDGLDDIGLLSSDIEDARAALDTLGMLRC